MKLTDEQVSRIVDLLLKLDNLDIDPGKLAAQAKELYVSWIPWESSWTVKK